MGGAPDGAVRADRCAIDLRDGGRLRRKGNERFRTAKPASRDYLEEQHADAMGQAPAAVVLGCIDSRVPADVAGVARTNVTLGLENLAAARPMISEVPRPQRAD